MASYTEWQVPAAGSHHKVYFVPVCFQSKLESPLCEGPFSPEHLVANIWMLLGYHNGL